LLYLLREHISVLSNNVYSKKAQEQCLPIHYKRTTRNIAQ